MIQPHAEGDLRLDPKAPEPWRYRGTLRLPSGRYAVLHARVVENDAGKHFQIQAGLEPGMTSAELDEVLVRIETERATIARRALEDDGELPF